MFRECKYTEWYFAIVNKAKSLNRQKCDDYFENHHIIPKAMGGKRTKDNMVLLTAREHFICHWLLVKMVIDPIHKRSMSCAIHRMTHGNGNQSKKHITARQFEIARKIFSQSQTGFRHSDETKAKLREYRHSDEMKTKLSILRSGTTHSEETKAKISKSLTKENKREKKSVCKIDKQDKRKLPRSTETKEKIAASKIGKRRSPEAIAAVIAGKKRKQEERLNRH